jgi:hypothetical protein
MKTTDLNEITTPTSVWHIIYAPHTIEYDCLDEDVKFIYYPIMDVLKVCIHASK